MATSSWRQIHSIMEHIEDIALATEGRPRILDLGCGWGRYGVLIRDSWPNAEIIGVDARPDRCRWPDAYDDLFEVVLPNLPGYLKKFDLVLLIDVIEHLTRDDAHATLRAARKLVPVLVATPNGHTHQAGERYDEHLTGWTGEDLHKAGAALCELVPDREREPCPHGPGHIIAIFPPEAR